eukprot:m.264833 g.264833  ORF g.264833 m.264833 type:complete len:182 (+) comp40480_c0_seq28:53-598(+)
MVKSCCAVGCTSRCIPGSKISFYRFPKEDTSRRARWISAVKRKNWSPGDHTWICSLHFASGSKRDDPLSPDFVPSVFNYVSSPVKRRKVSEVADYDRRKRTREKRSNAMNEMLESRKTSAAACEVDVAEVLSSTESGMASVENGIGTQTDLTGTLVDQLMHESSRKVQSSRTVGKIDKGWS